jgi:opacity protein-like surface antigen
MKTFFLGAAIALGLTAPAIAAEDYTDQICIVWDNTGTQVYGAYCALREKYDGNKIAVGDGAGMDAWGKEWQFIIDKKGNVIGHFGNFDIKGVKWTRKDGMWYWSNGAPALSIEENESEMYD